MDQHDVLRVLSQEYRLGVERIYHRRAPYKVANERPVLCSSISLLTSSLSDSLCRTELHSVLFLGVIGWPWE
jgi:hypothetical protein